MERYNYVIFGSRADFHRTSYRDVFEKENIRYCDRQFEPENALLRAVKKLHFSYRIEQKVNLPFKWLWNPYLYFKNDFACQRPLCFLVFAGRQELFKYGVIDYMKRRYPDARFVLFYQDLVDRQRKYPLHAIRDKFDLVLSFDQSDCAKYGLTYYPLVYSPIPEEELRSDLPESDVYFVGKAKDRLGEILDAYRVLRDAGLRCDFHITGVAPENQQYADEIDYCGQMPYAENLKRIYKTRCLLEIMQQGGSGYTLRMCEAIMLDKKLLTNNPAVTGAPYYSPERIQTFQQVWQIDPVFITEGERDVDYGWKEELSPLKLLQFIENYFERNGSHG